MVTPRDVSGLRWFLGMINQMGNFSSKWAQLSQPLRKLLKGRVLIWDVQQEKGFKLVKEELCQPKVLFVYHPNAETKS